MDWGAPVGMLSMWPSKKEQFGLQAPGASIWVAAVELHFQAGSEFRGGQWAGPVVLGGQD